MVKKLITSEKFMDDLEREYPNEDWGNVPHPDTFPDVYTVHGKDLILNLGILNIFKFTRSTSLESRLKNARNGSILLLIR